MSLIAANEVEAFQPYINDFGSSLSSNENIGFSESDDHIRRYMISGLNQIYYQNNKMQNNLFRSHNFIISLYFNTRYGLI
ncbi:hypothetical protein Q426_04860 [Streptococcus equi subsp. zooepidemicus CY]|nr:hypothetical protein Q426_04860 [Streptococcus equi subsp. zooepidemicus CY]